MSTITSAPPPAATMSAAAKVADQTGIIGGANPQHYNKNDPIVIFIVQAFLIVVLCRLLHWPLSRIRQPRVIAEVIGGIILGPTVMGRIPNFTTTIFPVEAMPNLNLIANLGLVLFLFIIGLEVDFKIMVDNWRIALGVGTMGIMLPFGFGAAISYGLYNEFGKDVGVKEDVNFGIFLLFVGVAFSITAFPVLCRILTELRLLGTNVGVIVLSAGSGDDVVGWILLALTVALVNAGTGITALYVLLVAVGYILFLFLVVKRVFAWYLRRTGNLDGTTHGPSQTALTITLLLCIASAWFANVIGIHAIFGGFVVGLICPRDGAFAASVAEKIEDLVTVLFLPLYFTLSGLRTNIGLLDSGIVWGYVFGVLFVAFFAKITGATLAARFFGLRWRESLAVGSLMQCKGLVELIVLNIGLTAGIISQRVFTIFVVMALVTTFATTPLVSFLYPEWYQKKCLAWRAGKINWDGTPTGQADDEPDADAPKVKTSVSRITALLRLDSLPSLMALVVLLKGEKESLAPATHRSKKGEKTATTSSATRFEVHGLRLRELDERTSAIMRATEDGDTARDPAINFFKAFGRMNSIACATGLSVIPASSYSNALSGHAKDTHSDLVVVPWSETGHLGDDFISEQTPETKATRFESGPYVTFINSLLQETASNVAIFINRGFGGLSVEEKKLKRRNSNISGAISRVKSVIEEPTLPILDHTHHIFFPYIGGADDRAALRFVLQLAKNINVTATVVQIVQTGATETKQTGTAESDSKQASTVQASSSNSDADDEAFYLQIAASLPEEVSSRVVFETIGADQAIPAIVTRAKQELGTVEDAGDLVIVGQSHAENFDSQLAGVTEEHAPNVSVEARRAMGSVAAAMLVSQVKASVLVYKSS